MSTRTAVCVIMPIKLWCIFFSLINFWLKTLATFAGITSYYNKVVSTPTFGRDKNNLEGEGA